MFNFSKLRGLIREKGLTQHDVAQHLKITDNAFSRKIKGKSYFSIKETSEICDLLGIDKDDIGKYFFAT